MLITPLINYNIFIIFYDKMIDERDDYMFCRNCGNKLEDNDKFCGVCGTPKFTPNNVQGTPVINNGTKQQDNTNDKVIFGVIGFFAPIVGIILSIVSQKEKPEAAKVGLIVSIIRFGLNILYFIFVFGISFFDYI